MKKQKTLETAGLSHHVGSRIFSPFRTVGLVSNRVPFAVTTLGQSLIITTVVGKSFQIYDAASLHLLFVSQPQTDSEITCVHSHFQHVFVAWTGNIGVFKRGRMASHVEVPITEKIFQLLTFGEYVCAMTKSQIFVYKWEAKAAVLEQYTTLKVPALLGEFVAMAHPPTYLNKLLVATSSSLLLFNVKKGALIHTFEEIPEGISLIEASPVALDVVAIVSRNGDVHLCNFRKGVELFCLKVGEPISTLTFRSDGTPMLGLGTPNGDLFFYDLNLRRRVHSIRGLHVEGGVVKAEFLPGQPVAVSAGGDNKIVELAFDPSLSHSNTSIAPPPRVLRQRGGHSRPPSSLSFTDNESHFILSGSLDETLWGFSLRKDSQSYEFSQREKSGRTKINTSHTGDKFPAITDLAYQANKQSQWDNILTAHKGEEFARTWSGKRGKVGPYQFKTIDGGIAKRVYITNCGNFGFVGSSNGGISGYNMQSGMIRKRLPKAHSREVTGISVDAVNSIIISSSLEGKVKFHDFQTLELVQELDCRSAITHMRLHNGCRLLAVALEDLAIYVIDIVTKKIVRELWGHGNRITSFDFTPDGRWIISGSLDYTIRTWDIPSGGCIDAVRVATPVTCLRVSPTDEYLATAHVQGVGIQLWTMKSQFMRVSTRHISENEVNDISMPNVAGQGSAGLLDGAVGETAQYSDDVDVNFDSFTAPEKLSQALETLSLQPRFKFSTLVHLEAIKERNKAKETIKTPERLPFFLTGGSDSSHTTPVSNGPLVPTPDKLTGSKFTELLMGNKSSELAEYLAAQGPAATDLEIRSLNTRYPHEELIAFVNAMGDQVKERKNFELAQAWMNMALRIHADTFVDGSESLKAALAEYNDVQKAEIHRIKTLVQFCLGVSNYLRTI